MVDTRLVATGDRDYPVGLLDLEQPPSVYVIGRPSPAPAIAVVGSRASTRYGNVMARAFGRALAYAGWTTVSGLARGIDKAAHLGCLEAGGEAVAVLGSGIDVVYPIENRSLYEQILGQGGTVISEYPPGTPPDRWRFPARNRLIAAISSAVVVVEAGDKGGALITARFAAELGRPVFAVPGDIGRATSIGCNRLIRDGAHPVLGAEDLIIEVGLTLGSSPRAVPAGMAPIPVTGVLIDDLPGLWGCSPSEALARLTRLELNGELRRSGDLVLPG